MIQKGLYVQKTVARFLRFVCIFFLYHVFLTAENQEKAFVSINTGTIHTELEIKNFFTLWDRTKTGIGRQQLSYMFALPITDRELLEKRQQVVKTLVENDQLREKMSSELSRIVQMERFFVLYLDKDAQSNTSPELPGSLISKSASRLSAWFGYKMFSPTWMLLSLVGAPALIAEIARSINIFISDGQKQSEQILF